MSQHERVNHLLNARNQDNFLSKYVAFKQAATPEEWQQWGDILFSHVLSLNVSPLTFERNSDRWIEFLQDYSNHCQQRLAPNTTHHGISIVYSDMLQAAVKHNFEFFTHFVNQSLPHCFNMCDSARTVVREILAWHGEDFLDLANVVFNHVGVDELVDTFCDGYDTKQLMFDRWALEWFAQRTDLSAQTCARLAQCKIYNESADIRVACEIHSARHQREALIAVVAPSKNITQKKM